MGRVDLKKKPACVASYIGPRWEWLPKLITDLRNCSIYFQGGVKGEWTNHHLQWDRRKMTYLKQISFACFTIPSDLVESRIITMLAQMRFPWEMVSKRSFAWEVYTKKQRIWTSQLMVLDCLYFCTAQLSLEPSSSQKQPLSSVAVKVCSGSSVFTPVSKVFFDFGTRRK